MYYGKENWSAWIQDHCLMVSFGVSFGMSFGESLGNWTRWNLISELRTSYTHELSFHTIVVRWRMGTHWSTTAWNLWNSICLINSKQFVTFDCVQTHRISGWVRFNSLWGVSFLWLIPSFYNVFCFVLYKHTVKYNKIQHGSSCVFGQKLIKI